MTHESHRDLPRIKAVDALQSIKPLDSGLPSRGAHFQIRSMSALRCLAIAATSCVAGCILRTSPAPPTPCTALSVNFNEWPRFVNADSTPSLTLPYTVIVDDLVIGVVYSDSSAVVAEMRGIDGSSIRAREIVPAVKVRARWPSATGDVLHLTRCHEPTRTNGLFNK